MRQLWGHLWYRVVLHVDGETQMNGHGLRGMVEGCSEENVGGTQDPCGEARSYCSYGVSSVVSLWK